MLYSNMLLTGLSTDRQEQPLSRARYTAVKSPRTPDRQHQLLVPPGSRPEHVPGLPRTEFAVVTKESRS